MISDTATNDEQREYADILKKNSELLLMLVNNILDIGRLDAGRMKFDIVECELVALIQEIVFRLGRGNAVEINFTTDLSTCLIHTDSSKIGQILANIINNAIAFTANGKVDVRLADVEGKVIVVVDDYGKGFPKGHEEEAFELFEKLDSFGPGSGLGLSMSRAFARKLGGDVYVDSNYECGARVIFELKRDLVQDEVE